MSTVPHHHTHTHHHVNERTVLYLTLSFSINILLSLVEIIGGIIAGSVSLIGDALHNTSDAFSILIAVVAFKIGHKKADAHYTYGFKRAETIGGFVNLILLFISGLYLLAEGFERLISPTLIEGKLIIWISVLALIIDSATAKLSHHHAEGNTNMRMVFIHNLADAFGSIGVIISGLCVVWFDIFWIDGVIAIAIAVYMIYQSVVSFPHIVRILMNAAPADIDIPKIRKALLKLPKVKDVHHLHIWHINEHDIALDCHLVTTDITLVQTANRLLNSRFGITHTNIQIESSCHCDTCPL